MSNVHGLASFAGGGLSVGVYVYNEGLVGMLGEFIWILMPLSCQLPNIHFNFFGTDEHVYIGKAV